MDMEEYEYEHENDLDFESKQSDRGIRRKKDFTHALRKKRKSDSVLPNSAERPWYNNLHQYSKGKIHCSCPLCASNPYKDNSKESRSFSDRKRLQGVNEEINELDD